MRITVECGGFTRAADACLTANQTSAVLTESLASRLSGGAGMAGDDATSTTFSQAYDDGAREAVAALADLTHAFIGAGRLLGMTADNHELAEVAAAGQTVLGYTGGSLDDSAFVRVQPTPPPSSRGGGGAAAAAAAARVRAQAPRYFALLTTLRTGVAVASARIERACDELVALRARVERFLRIPARGEVGSMRLTRGAGAGRTPGRPKPDVSDPKLSNYVDQLFKGVDNPKRIGDGTTMDAIRHELRTGETVHNRRHVIKGGETLRGLERWLRQNPDAPTSDRSIARKLADEIREALQS